MIYGSFVQSVWCMVYGIQKASNCVFVEKILLQKVCVVYTV